MAKGHYINFLNNNNNNTLTQVYESSGLSTNLLTSVYAAVPERNVTSESSFLAEIDFSSELRQTHSHDAVGSGERRLTVRLCCQL